MTGETSNSFTLLITGYSTTRSLGALNVTFTPASGYNLSTTSFTIDVSSEAALWFQSSASQSFGGLFEITQPFTLPGKVPVNKTLIQAIASAAVTVADRQAPRPRSPRLFSSLVTYLTVNTRMRSLYVWRITIRRTPYAY